RQFFFSGTNIFYDRLVISFGLCYIVFRYDKAVTVGRLTEMPTNTFFRLPKEKRRRIFSAAVKEFSNFSFACASINRIVRLAGIPRGSFYQYFSDKEDLYMHVITVIGEEKMEIFQRFAAPVTQTGFFGAVKASLPAVLEWLDCHPDYNRIGFFMAGDDSPFIKGIRDRANLLTDRIVSMLKADQKAGLIREDLDPAFLLQVYTDASFALFREFYAPGGREKISRRLTDLIELLQQGAAPREASL
ncbi:MAG: TetR/AcrR family transcriptional regulator, partial [Pygmaiobacter sp.]|nr:TetR/AcrR family transcriptional regulator [Pygmaiobacter sp.]